MDEPLKVKRYVEQCKKLAEIYTHIIFCPWEDKEIVPNQKRTLDPWYQFTVHSVQLAVMSMFGEESMMLTVSDVEERVKYLLPILKS